jgi:hypothetical protein
MNPRLTGWIGIFAAFFSLMFSLVDAPTCGLLIILALLSSLLSLTAFFYTIHKGKAKTRWGLLMFVLPVILFTIDNIGRALAYLALPYFRII